MKKKQLIVFLVLNAFLLAFTVNVFGQVNETTLKDKRVTINRKNESLGTIFRDLIETYDIPIGFEESIFDRNHSDYLFETNIPCVTNCIDSSGKERTTIEQTIFKAKDIKFSIEVENEPLENVLNQIVSTMKYYKWEINDDVVNIIPIIGRDKRLEDLLNVKIKSFANVSGSGNLSKRIVFISSSIALLPEIKDYLINNNIHLTNGAYRSQNNGRDLPDNLMLTNVTLKELLNKITKYKRGGWALRKNPLNQLKNFEVFEIDI